jgi:hypothetical protein
MTAIMIDERKRHHEIIDRLPDGPCTWVEVGVYRGDNASKVMKGRPLARLLAVDPWLSPLGTGNTFGANDVDMARKPQSLFDRWYRETVAKLSRFGKRVKIVRATSVETAAGLRADQVFDLVFIDGDHSYEACRDDIRAWSPHVAPGGWIGGHDYGKARFPGVTRAVDEEFHGFPAGVYRGCDSTWWVQRQSYDDPR